MVCVCADQTRCGGMLGIGWCCVCVCVCVCVSRARACVCVCVGSRRTFIRFFGVYKDAAVAPLGGCMDVVAERVRLVGRLVESD